MTMTRAFVELQRLGFVISKVEGTKKVFSTSQTTKVLFDRSLKHFRSPIATKVYTDNMNIIESCPIAGLHALSTLTMLNPPHYQIRAIQKDDKRLDNIKFYNEDRLENENTCELELWYYDPNLFCREGVVNIVSLIASLQNTKDERIQIEIEELLEGYKW